MMPKLEPIDDWTENVDKSPPPDEIIEDILFDTNEVNVIVGRSSIGKTNFANQLAHSIANEDVSEFIGQKILSHHTVSYTGFEVDKHQFNKRNKKLEKHIPGSPLLWVCNPAPFFKLDKNTKTEFQNTFSGFKMNIIDPVKYIMQGSVLDPDATSAFLQILQEVMRANNSMAIVVLYFKKLDNRSPLEPDDLWNIKGATEWGDIPSTVLMMERTKQGHKVGGGFAPVDKDAVTLYFAKTRNAANIHDPINIHWNRQKCLFEKV